MVKLEIMQVRTQENSAFQELSSDEMARAQAIFQWGASDWFNYSPRERRVSLMPTQTINHRDRSVAPIIRIDSQLIPNQTQLTVLFEREDGSMEDSRFRMCRAFRTDQADVALAELEMQGYKTGVVTLIETERVLQAA